MEIVKTIWHWWHKLEGYMKSARAYGVIRDDGTSPCHRTVLIPCQSHSVPLE